jgi:uncharacterized protein (UPF0335 family)
MDRKEQLRTKALTVKFTPDEYKALRVYAMDKDMSHQDVIHAAVLEKILKKDVRDHNAGSSDYSTRKIQPWDIWLEYSLNAFDADIIKRVLRKKQGESRRMEYEKIIHVCEERIRQIDEGGEK